MTTKQTVAEWLVDKIRVEGTLHEEEAVYLLEKRFGSEGVHRNVNGDPTIKQTSLKQFRQIHGGAIQWDNTERSWTVI